MRLAWRELRRQPSRFAVATVILSLIAILLMFLGGLLDGLIGNATGAYEAQRAQAIVYSATAQDSLARSRIDGDTRAKVQADVGDATVGGLGSISLGGRIDGRGPRDLVTTTLYGYELAPKGLPATPPAAGEVYADDSLRADDVSVGTVIKLGPDETPITIIGFVDAQENRSSGALWGSLDTWRSTLEANVPGQRVGDDVVQALVISYPGEAVPTSGDLDQIDAATGGATRALTIDDAVAAIPGVSAQRSTFNQILGVTIGIAIVVVALFFALLTVERTGLYGVLKAVGARSRTLFAGVMLQAVVVTLIASVIGVGASLLFAALIPPGSIPFQIGAVRLLGSVGVLLIAAVIGCAFSLRRVLRVDPAAAIGGAA